MRALFILAAILITSCTNSTDNIKVTATPNTEFTSVITDTYELIKPENAETLLILFPGGGGNSKDTKVEFDIIEKAIENNVSVLMMNFNLHFWIDHATAEKLSNEIQDIVRKNDLNANKVFIGGMSIGGNVALLLANHLSLTNAAFKPEGVFVVDSPIDLNVLYKSARKDASTKYFSEERLAEPRFIIGYIEGEFGDSSQVLTNIQLASPIILETESINIKALKNCEVRFYTEPDSLWWMENRQTDFENTNSFVIQRSVQLLNSRGWNKVELVETANKGYRANGERHPHSWSIVNVDDLIMWMKKE